MHRSSRSHPSTLARPWVVGLACALTLGLAPTTSFAQFLEDDVQVIYERVGENDGDNFGILVEAIGDLNGDGVEEFLAQAPFEDSGATNGGKSYLFDGKSGTVIRTHVGTVPNGNIQRGGEAGLLDTDAVPDYLVAAWPQNFNSDPGRVWAYSGADGSLIQSWVGEVNGDQFGHDVAILPDIDGDGWGEVAIGASLKNVGGAGTGRVYVYSARDGSLQYSIDGPMQGANFGHTLANVGDLDGDGFDDLAVGSPEGRGLALVGPGHGYLHSGANGSLIRSFDAPVSGSVFLGSWISTPRIDLNGDGFSDLLLTDQFDNTLGPQTGRLTAYDGTNGSVLWTRKGRSPRQGYGACDGIGDVTGDGIEDLVVSAWRSPDGGAPFTGKIHIRDGQSGDLLRVVTSTDAGGAFGGKPCGLGDVDGDGFNDILVNVPMSSAPGPGRGRLMVIRGQDHRPSCLQLSVNAPLEPGTPTTFTIRGGAPGAQVLLTASRGNGGRGTIVSGQFDANGEEVVGWIPPLGTSGLALRFQALQASPSCVSQFVDRVVQ